MGKKKTEAHPVKRDCFTCNGTGKKCDMCGESPDCCDCEEETGEVQGQSDCENCNGTGTVLIPVLK